MSYHKNHGPPEGYRGPKECQADPAHGRLHFDALGQARCVTCEPFDEPVTTSPTDRPLPEPTATLDDIRKKFPNANYAPREGCKYCGGTGEKTTRPGMPCICIFVEHDMCDFAAESLAETAKKLMEELKGESR